MYILCTYISRFPTELGKEMFALEIPEMLFTSIFMVEDEYELLELLLQINVTNIVFLNP